MRKHFAVLLTIIIAFGFLFGVSIYGHPSVIASDSPDIKLSTNYLGLEEGQKRTVLVYLSSDSSNYEVEWSSSNNENISVDSYGTITAVKEGTAVVTASVEELGISAECNVVVLSGHISGNFDFSESNMITNSSFEDPYGTNFTADDGGNTNMAISYLTRWDGAVLEENDKFPASLISSDLIYKEIDSDYHLQEAIFIPNRNSYLDNDRIKEAVIEYGAVYASFAVNNKCFGYNSVNYFRPEYLSPVDGGHAVAIVGWDDEYSKENFEYTPDGDGAFICKNSWGTASGENGYLYISYYDASIGKRDIMTAYTGLETASNYNKIYQYDPYGCVETIYGSDEKTFFAANVFPADSSKLSADEELSAVSFYTYSENTAYEIFAIPDYKSTESLSSERISLKSGIIEKTGYYTIDFDPVLLKAGTRFAIIVKLSVEDGDCRFYAESPVVDYSEGARANSGESFYAFDGNNWNDLTDEFENCNLCIKAFTKTSSNSSAFVLSGINNETRDYESNKIYTVNEIANRKNSDINPEFVDYINSLDSGLSKAVANSTVKHTSIPSPIVISSSIQNTKACNLPAKFNLNDEKSLTPVKNQGDINGCWSFATYASLESCLLRNASNLMSIPESSKSTDEIDAIIDATNTDLTGLKLNYTEKELLVSETIRLTADALPLNAKLGNIKWTSSDSDVASVSHKGTVTAKYPGTVKIIAENTDNKIIAYCNLTVKPRSFTVTWITDGKEHTQSVSEFSPIVPNVIPQKTGHTFIGWNPALPETMPSRDVTFTAEWTVNSYETLFDANGGKWSDGYSSKTVSTLYNESIEIPPKPAKEGYDFAGWNDIIPESMPAENLSFSAKWTPRNDTKYTVNIYTMNPDGQYYVSSETYIGTTEETAVASVGVINDGFFINKEKSNLSGTIYGDGSLTLSVYIDRHVYTLKTVTEGVETDINYYFEQPIEQPSSPYKKGYYFIGWSPEIPLNMPAENITVNAVFEKLYSISIKNNVGPKTVNYGDTLVLTAEFDELPENAEIAWYLNGNGFDGKISEDGKTCYLTSTGSGSAQITVAIANENGEPYVNPDGKEVYSSQTINSKAGFFQKIISFFKNLFGFDRYILQNIINILK